jgi:hypothetical protein
MKSHVSLGQHVCPVCLSVHDSGEVLLDRRLQNSLEQRTITDWGMCPEHQKLKDDGFVALVELAEAPARGAHPLHTPRTGRIAHIRESAWPFNIPVPPGKVVVVEVGVIDRLRAPEMAEA